MIVTRWRRRWRWWVAAAILAFSPARADALIFEDVRPDELARVSAAAGKSVLWVRNCGALSRDRVEQRKCEPRETRFSPGDGRALDEFLVRARSRGRRYDEVWLYSGGGTSNEGFLVGRVLRKWQMTVRIPSGARCASACTVAFMGGFFRYIEDGAAYMVHSASQWANGFDCEDDDPDCYAKAVIEGLTKSPAMALAAVASRELEDARFSAQRRLVHFQNALLQPVGQSVPEGDGVDLEIRSRARERRSVPSIYAGSEQIQSDVTRLRSEGVSAAQDILMRIERASMAQAIQELRANVGQFGRRAEAALRMIEVMFQTSILETATLSAETLLRMGFVTRDVLPAQ